MRGVIRKGICEESVGDGWDRGKGTRQDECGDGVWFIGKKREGDLWGKGLG